MKKTLQFLGFKKTKTRKKFDYYFIKGFTLVEIIGAIVLLTVIGLIIYPVINNLVVIETLDNTTNTSADGIKSSSGYVQMVKLFIHSL